MQFEWDPLKATLNRRKHGVDFADVIAVLDDDQALTMRDECPEEERFVTIGRDYLGGILVVVYVWRGRRIRVISARRANRRERGEYLG